jgi:hypothetical protein
LSRSAEKVSRTFTPNNLFVFAAMDGSLDLVMERNTAEVDIDYNEPGKGSSLPQAAHRRHGDIVEWLLSQGADPDNFFDGWMQRPMDAALDGNRAIPSALRIWRAGGHATGYPFRTPKFGRGNRVPCRLDSEITDTIFDESHANSVMDPRSILAIPAFSGSFELTHEHKPQAQNTAKVARMSEIRRTPEL